MTNKESDFYDMKILTFDVSSLPISEDLKLVIEERLRQDEKAREEITRLGILEFIKKYGGEIQMKNTEYFKDLEIEITNVVVDTELDQKIDLNLVKPIMRELHYEFLGEIPRGHAFKRRKTLPKVTVITLNESGEISCAGNKIVEDGKESLQEVLRKLESLGFGKSKNLRTLVWQKTELRLKIELEIVKPILQDIEQINDVAEWWGIYRPEYPEGKKGPNIALFGNGRIVSAGSPSPEVGKKAINNLVSKLREIKAF